MKPHWLLRALAFLISPIAEKNPLKVWASISPVVLSARRIALLYLTICIGEKLASVDVVNWPLAFMLALSVLGWALHDALGKRPEKSIELASQLIGRSGIGDIAPGSGYGSGFSSWGMAPAVPLTPENVVEGDDG